MNVELVSELYPQLPQSAVYRQAIDIILPWQFDNSHLAKY